MLVRRSAAVLLGLLAVLVLFARVDRATAAPDSARGQERAKRAPKDRKSNDTAFRWCRLQKPKDFLKRRSFVKKGTLNGSRHNKALKYRVEKYGSIPGVGFDELNSESAYSQATVAHFMGLPMQVHEKIVPALRCVERRIQKVCRDRDERYVARAVGGFRSANSYRGGEVSNHLFGIAVDIDPDRNPCCGCVDPWPSHKLCQNPSATIYEKTELPRCWIGAFERYGFYWLGRDSLEDTMHFEFLGDPDRILP